MPLASLPRDRTRPGRYAAAAFAVLALLCFYAPWISASLPGASPAPLSGADLARGAAAGRAGAGSTGARGLTLPTRIATPGMGAGDLVSGDLVLPTRIPTPADGGQESASGPGGASALPTAVADPLLPTRQPSGPAVATAAAATVVAIQTAQASGARPTAPAESPPDRLPGTLLYGVPLAAAGVAVFSTIWGRLREARDRLYGQLWTVLLASGGAFGVGYVLLRVATAPRPNDLLGPGEVQGAEWGLWGALLAFLLCSLALGFAWSRAQGEEGRRGAPP